MKFWSHYQQWIPLNVVFGGSIICLTLIPLRAQADEFPIVHIEPPKNHPECANTARFMRIFHETLDSHQSEVPSGANINVLMYEVAPNTFKFFLALKSNEPHPHIRWPQPDDPQNNCIEALEYAASVSATLILPPKPPISLIQPVIEQRLVGFHVAVGLSPTAVLWGPYTGASVTFNEKLMFEIQLSVQAHTAWTTPKGREIDISLGSSTSFGVSYLLPIGTRFRLGLGLIGTFGGYNGTSWHLHHPEDAGPLGTYYLTGGARTSFDIQLSKTTTFRISNSFSGVSIIPALQIGLKPDWQGPPITSTLQFGWIR